jgi:chromosome segregation ATPase
MDLGKLATELGKLILSLGVLGVLGFLAIDKLDTIDTSIKDNNTAVEKLANTITALQSELSEDKGAIVGLNNSGADLRQTISQTFTIAEAYSAKIDSLIQKVDDLQSTATDTDRNLDTVFAKVSDLQYQVASLRIGLKIRLLPPSDLKLLLQHPDYEP